MPPLLARVLEPEVMDTLDEALAYDAMDHNEVNAAFVADFLAIHGPCRGGLVLDIGTGTARIPIELCKRDRAAMVLAIDLSDNMLEIARRNVDAAKLSDRISLGLVDAKAIETGSRKFEAVISNSIIHHIPDPFLVMSEIARLVVPGGTGFVRDLARPRTQAELDRLVTTYCGEEGDHARRLFAGSLHAALTLDEVRGLVDRLGLPTSTVVLTSDRHWTWAWTQP